jgi:hypothetical protein
MVRHLRLGITTIWMTALLVVAIIAAALNSGGGPRRVAVQATPAVAASLAAGSLSPSSTAPKPTIPAATSTVAAPITVPPTTVATVLPTPTPAAAAARRVTTPAVRTTVAPSPAPAPVTRGNASDYTTVGYRWNPCRIITVNDSNGPDVTGIVTELASITGLHFMMVTSNAEINISWGAVTASPSGEVGVTVWKAINGWLAGATVVIGHGAQPFLATVLRHEMGHAMGLNHSHYSGEVMYATVGSGSPTDYQAGDRAGLQAVGASKGC